MKLRLHILIGFALALLAACSGTPIISPVDVEARADEARRASLSGDTAAARELYAALVDRTTGIERSGFRIELARAEQRLGNNEAALAALDAIAIPLSPELDAERAAVRAEVFFAVGRTAEAVGLLVEREIWLDSSAAISANQRMIWDGLATPESRQNARIRTGDPTIDGWLALAPLTELTDDDQRLRDALVDWSAEFGNHPAGAGILAERLAAMRPAGVRPNRIALLLPLSSAVRSQARVLRDGFFAAYYAFSPDDTSITVYDTALLGSAASVEAALRDGADIIVGPLLDDEVDEARMRAGFVPILALNIGTDTSLPAQSFYRFSLSSDDEVEAIAARAITEGHETAVILHSDADRGYDMRNAFRAAFEARGGRIINSAAYIPEAQAFDTPIKSLLNISESEARNSRLNANLQVLGLGLEFEPRRRADIDMIFLQAGPGIGRLLVPLLEQNLAEDLPTYAMSEVYDPNRAGGDPDLDRLIFPDLPLLVDPSAAGQAAEMLDAFSSDSTARFRRMFAFGFDAFRVAAELYGQTATAPGWRLSGASGELYLDSNGRVRRILPFAEFSGGRPRPAAPAQSLAGT